MILPDVLAPGLAVVFCGTAPGRASKEASAYYAHPGNRFWLSLHRTGLTPELLAPHQYREGLRFGIGLTDLNKVEWGSDAELSPLAFDVAGFRARMLHFRPRHVAFTSKKAAGTFLGRPRPAYGRQQETLEGIVLWVLPSPSGRARGWWDPGPWQALASCVRGEPGQT